jgi:hypothetical protein
MAGLLVVSLSGTAMSKVDLVTLPHRDAVQLTIYNSADLTLVRDQRTLTLRQGTNRLQFSWANTLIDPTSLFLDIPKHRQSVDILEIDYPPGVRETGVWSLDSRIAGKVSVEITAFTSGLSWKSFYLATLTPDNSHMDLQGYVRVTNHSGEDYENAQTRLVVGNINLLETIAQLARRDTPYGRPWDTRQEKIKTQDTLVSRYKEAAMLMDAAQPEMTVRKQPKEITKQGLSEYFLYTIEGTETIKNGWSKRLPSFQAKAIPVKTVYKYDQDLYGHHVIRFLEFSNDKAHNLGETPLPGGQIKVFRQMDSLGNGVQYIGSDQSRYIPVDQEIKLNLGQARLVTVEPKIMNYQKTNLVFDEEGHINGFDQIKDSVIELTNANSHPVAAVVTLHVASDAWELIPKTHAKAYEKVDHNTFKYTLELQSKTTKTIKYRLIEYHGERRYQHS